MDKTALLTERIPRTEVEIDGVGTVTVRGLSRYELHLSGKGADDAAVIERRMIAIAMVDPELTEAEVELWQKNSSAGELAAVTVAIRDLSGLKSGADKEAYKSLRGEPDA
jgi:hypothetical protein